MTRTVLLSLCIAMMSAPWLAGCDTLNHFRLNPWGPQDFTIDPYQKNAGIIIPSEPYKQNPQPTGPVPHDGSHAASASATVAPPGTYVVPSAAEQLPPPRPIPKQPLPPVPYPDKNVPGKNDSTSSPGAGSVFQPRDNVFMAGSQGPFFDQPELIRKSDYPANTALNVHQLTSFEKYLIKPQKDLEQKKVEESLWRGAEEQSQPVLPVSREPVVVALECLLNNKPDHALAQLRSYDAQNQELMLCLLPIIAQMAQTTAEQIDPQEILVMHDKLDSLLLELRSRAKLTIDEMCCCEQISGYGVYKPLPPDHVFLPMNDHRLGECVQVYVQLRNVSSKKRGDYYETNVTSAIEFSDASGKQLVYLNLKEQDKPINSKTLRRDHFIACTFHVPRMPPGDHFMTIYVKDITQPGEPREAKKTIPFRVGR